jgi:hypothetical protein
MKKLLSVVLSLGMMIVACAFDSVPVSAASDTGGDSVGRVIL